MSEQSIGVRGVLFDALQVDLIGPSGALGYQRKVLPQSPSRWNLTGFLIPTDGEEDKNYDLNSDDEMNHAPTVATVDENQAPEQAASKRFSQLHSIVVKSMSVAASAPKHQSLDQARALFQGSIDAEEDFASRKAGMTVLKTGFVYIA